MARPAARRRKAAKSPTPAASGPPRLAKLRAALADAFPPDLRAALSAEVATFVASFGDEFFGLIPDRVDWSDPSGFRERVAGRVGKLAGLVVALAELGEALDPDGADDWPA